MDPMTEKAPLQSKKFVAYLVAEATWKLVLAGGLGGSIYVISQGHTVPAWLYWVLLTIVIIAGFVEAGFIGGQAWLDKYVRVAHITATNGPFAKNPGAGGDGGGDTPVPPDTPTTPVTETPEEN